MPDTDTNSVDGPKNPNQEKLVKSINVLIQSVMKGQRAGAYTLEEAVVIMDSIKHIQVIFGGEKA
jgi:hypothetical protein